MGELFAIDIVPTSIVGASEIILNLPSAFVAAGKALYSACVRAITFPQVSMLAQAYQVAVLTNTCQTAHPVGSQASSAIGTALAQFKVKLHLVAPP